MYLSAETGLNFGVDNSYKAHTNAVDVVSCLLLEKIRDIHGKTGVTQPRGT